MSEKFREKQIFIFSEACALVAGLRYGRNRNLHDIFCVLDEGCGTCSSKHVLLKKLADENGCTDIRLCAGIYLMNAVNTPKAAAVLKKYNLEYIPEAHCYFRYHEQVLDFTTIPEKKLLFENDLVIETVMEASEVPDKKKKFIKIIYSNGLAKISKFLTMLQLCGASAKNVLKRCLCKHSNST